MRNIEAGTITQPRSHLHELKGEHQPGPRDGGDVDEAEAVAEQTRGKNLE